MIGLGALPDGGSQSFATAVSADGDVIVGYSNSDSGAEAFLWNSLLGMINFKDYLAVAGVDGLTGWTLNRAWDVSDDGHTIVGYGTNPAGNQEAWIATMPVPGDVNADGVVNIFDVNLVSAHWSESGPVGDANIDGVVNVFDINLISSNWMPTGGGSLPAVPEPSTFALTACAATLLVFTAQRLR